MKSRVIFASPIGPLTLVASEKGLCEVRFFGEAGAEAVVGVGRRFLDQAREELVGYFSGQLREFRVPLDLVGTVFQRRVWGVLGAIPYGRTLSYGEQAAKLGQPKAARAVGAANGKNPLPIIVPCHRVVGKDGALVGYSSGVERKKFLLELEERFVGGGAGR